MPTAKKQGKSKQNLLDFAKVSKREDCVVCRIPKEGMAQIAEARAQGVKGKIIHAWVKTEYGLDVDNIAFMRHTNGKHGA